MNFNFMSDTQIIAAIGEHIEKSRILKQISSENLAKKGGHHPQTNSNFINRGTNIKIETIIQIFRGLGELDKLQQAFEYKEPFSPYATKKKLPKRIWTKKNTNNKIVWGEE